MWSSAVVALAHVTVLTGLTKWQLGDRVIAGANKLVSKGKTIRKVAPFALALLERPLYGISADLAEGLIEGACQHQGILAKQF